VKADKKQPEQNDSPALLNDALRTYAAPWDGELVLACTKCRRKLKKKGGGAKALSNLKKWFKARSTLDEFAPNVRIVGIDCVKVCPKGGVTVTRQHQLCDEGREVSILRSKADLEALYRSLRLHPAQASNAAIIPQNP
jgi:hypothetical protein